MLLLMDFFTLSRHVRESTKISSALRVVVAASANVRLILLAFNMLASRCNFGPSSMHHGLAHFRRGHCVENLPSPLAVALSWWQHQCVHLVLLRKKVFDLRLLHTGFYSFFRSLLPTCRAFLHLFLHLRQLGFTQRL